MECNEIRDRLLAGSALPEPETREHVNGCAACALLVAHEAELGQKLSELAFENAEPPGLELLGDIEQRLLRERGLGAWLISRSTRARVAVVCACVAGLCVAQWLFRRRDDLAAYAGMRMTAILVAYAAAVLCAAGFALRPLSRPARRFEPAYALALIALPAVLALLPDAAAAASDDTHFVRAALRCFGYGGLLSAVAVVMLFALDRRGARAPRTLWFSAVCGGAAANAILQIHCANRAASHLLAGHASIGLAWFLVTCALYALMRREANFK